MGVSALVVAAALGAQLNVPGATAYFPGEYFDLTGRKHLTTQVLARWPGPSGLVRLWSSGELDEARRVVLLVGGAAHHDPTLLPVYAEAAVAESPRVRQAAAYGYRLLTGDVVPDVRRGVDAQTGRLLQREIGAMRATLRKHTLVQVWLQALLAGEGRGLPGWSGLILKRPDSLCLKAVDELLEAEDLPNLVAAYHLSSVERHRISLLKLIEGITLQRFIIRQKGERATWGLQDYRNAMGRFEAWLGSRCSLDAGEVVDNSMRRITGQRVDTVTAEGCSAWLEVLHHGHRRWWSLAADRLYGCGAPYHPIPILGAESKSAGDARELLLHWYQVPR